jgi:release factor glutamine methyltransferase
MTIAEAYQHAFNLGKVDDFSIREWLRYLHGLSSMSELVMHFDKPLKDHDRFLQGLLQLEKGMPVAYLIQETSFMGMNLYVDPRVLIPRPETEELIALTVKLMKQWNIAPTAFLDLGTGSGAIALACKKFFPDAFVMGIDLSEQALNVAKKNAERLKLDVIWKQSDWFSKIERSFRFPVILGNPPYIDAQATIDPSVWQYEPHEALIASPPTKHYQTMIVEGLSYLIRPGLMVFEIAPDLQPALTDFVQAISEIHQFGFEKDVNLKTRMLWILVK